MLSIQQLIKALRKLQNNTINGGDLVKSIKHVAASTSVVEGIPATTAPSTVVPTTLMTSLLNNHSEDGEELLKTTMTKKTSSLPKQQQQTNVSSNNSCSSHNASTTTSWSNNNDDDHDDDNNTNTNTTSSQRQQQQHQQQQQQTLNCHTSHNECFSLYSPLNADGSKYSCGTENSTTQDSSVNQTAVISSTLPLLQIHSSGHNHHRHQPQRSQRIQNFFQQQFFHHQQFHTQHNHNLSSKQKQTQFAMSSLAAEPLALQQKDDPNGGHQASDDESSSSSKAPQKQQNSTSGKPCFNAGLGDIIQFMELIGNLKHTKRTGWVLRDVNDCESISGHMYRMSILTFLLDGTEGLNQIRCMELALVHDLAESLVGDITPFCGVSKEEKKAMELKAMEDICKLIEPRGKRMMELFEEYEHGESPESRFVKDLDRLDMVMQAFEYEKRDNCLLKHQEFFDSTEGKFNHPFVKTLVNEIYEQREKLAKAKGATPPPKVEVPNMDNPQTHATKPQTTNGSQHIEENVETSKTS